MTMKNTFAGRQARAAAAKAAGAADAQLDRLDHALGHMASGLYPSCESCGQRIAMEALRADPARTLCSACEAQPRRPAP